MLQSMGSQRVRHNFVTEQQQEALNILSIMKQILNLQSDGNAINGYSLLHYYILNSAK